jgi:hypothetical protein
MNTSIEFAALVVSFIRATSPRANVRLLALADVEFAIAQHAATVAANPGARVRTRLVGGYVANSYGYRAEADRFEVETDAEGRSTFTAARAWAESKAHGRGDLTRTWIVSAAGAMKRAA